jgi:hypothetical protein
VIVAVTAILHDAALLPYYLEHYRLLGVERFAIGVDPDDLDPSGRLGAYVTAQPDVETFPLSRYYRRTSLVGANEEELRRSAVDSGDWIIPADLDELNQYPAALGELIGRLQETGATYVGGALFDRLAVDGSLAPLLPYDEGRSLWDQYPLGADITARFAQGATSKVLLSRADRPLALGHHHMADPGDDAAPLAERGTAHHFKWRLGLLDTLRWRIANERKRAVPWLAESQRLLDHLLAHGGFDAAAIGAVAAWMPPAARHVDLG